MRPVATALLLVLTAASAAAAPAPREIALTGEARERRAGIDERGAFFLEVRAQRGDGWWRLAQQSGLDANRWRELAAANGGSKSLKAGRWYRVPPELWPAGLGERVVKALFPDDRPKDGGWAHRVTRRKTNGRAESPWSLAQLFTGDGRRHPQLELERRTLQPGDIVVVPADSVLPHLRPRPDVAELNDTAGHAAPAIDDDVAEVSEPPTEPETFTVEAGTTSSDGLLTYEIDELGPHAVYQLRAGETLYSDVVIRFTGRLTGPSVNEAAIRFAERSSVRDVRDIPVGWRIRIPLEELRPEFLPLGHPRRVQWEAERRESARLANVPLRRGLSNVHVVLDIGHGGSDPGALSANVWEDDYAYDIACRLMVLLSDRSHAKVHPLIRDESTGFAPSSQLRRDEDEFLLTTPPLALNGKVNRRATINARWVLANDRRRELLREGVAEEQIVFLSIHADSLHPSASGSMAYIPSASLRPDRSPVPTSLGARKLGVTLAEYRQANGFRMSRSERLRAEGLSRKLADRIIESVTAAGLPVHAHSPIRDHVVRGSGSWVPAVLRLNRVPASVLFEACNLNNVEDRKRLRDPAFRQALAEALYSGIRTYFEEG